MSDKQSPENKKVEERIKKLNDYQDQVAKAYKRNQDFSAPVEFIYTDVEGNKYRGVGTLYYGLDNEKSYKAKQNIYSGKIQGYFPKRDSSGNVETFVSDVDGKTYVKVDKQFTFDNTNRAALTVADRIYYNGSDGVQKSYAQGSNKFVLTSEFNPRYRMQDKNGSEAVSKSVKIKSDSKGSPMLEYRVNGDLNLSRRVDILEDEMDQKAYNFAKFNLRYYNQDKTNIRSREIKGQQIRATNPGRISKKRKKAVNSLTKEQLDERTAETYAKSKKGRIEKLDDEVVSCAETAALYAKQLHQDKGYKQFQKNCYAWRKQWFDENS